MTAGLPVFDKTIQETNLWLKAVEQELEPCERHEAYDALRAVMHALRDRLQPESAMHLAAQLPLLLRGVYTEGWVLAKGPSNEHTAMQLGYRVMSELPPFFPINADRCLGAVFKVMSERMDEGLIAKVKDQLPGPIRRAWPEALPLTARRLTNA